MGSWSMVAIICDMLLKMKMWIFSGALFFFTFLLCPSSGHCIPGKDWHAAGPTSQDVGANSYTTAYLNITYIDPETKRVRTEKSEIGKFGDGRVGPASGVLVHVSSIGGEFTGCAVPLKSSVGDGALPQQPWIALVKRGQCNFEVKVENALKHNASAILVYNDRESSTLDKMKLSGARNVSAVFTYKWKGEQLANLVDGGTKVMVYITVATHCTRPNARVNRTSVLFVSISFVVLMLTSLAWLIFYYVQRFRYLHAKDRLSKRLCSAAKKALSKIPTKEIQQEDEEVQGDGECCAVCIEPYKVTDDLRVLPCRHEFHKSCIDPWLLEHRTCPMCKMNILKHYGFNISNSQESVLHVDLERGETEENEALRVPNSNGVERQTNIENNTSNASPCDAQGDQSSQVCSYKEFDSCCFRCRSILDKSKRMVNVGHSNPCSCMPKHLSIAQSQGTPVLLKSDAVNKENIHKTNNSDKLPSHFKSNEFFGQNICDSLQENTTNNNKRSYSCNEINNLNK